MGSSVVAVTYEAPVQLEQVRLNLVGFMERLYLADGRWPAHAGSDMFNSQLFTDPGKLGCSASGRLKLSPMVSKDLFGDAISFYSFLKKQNGVLAGWAPNLS